MTRNAVTKLYTATPGGATQGTDLRAWMAANLTEVTVGAMYTLGAGTSERNWWTLTFASGAEILVYCPNGTSMYGNNGFVERNTVESNFRQPLMLVYFPEGGAEAALANGEDPDTAGFKTYVQTTLGLREPDKGHQLMYWREGSGVNHQLHVIEDTDADSIVFILSQEGGIASGTFMSCYIASDHMWDQWPSASPQVLPAGCLFIESSNDINMKNFRHLHAAAWQTSDDARVLVATALNTLPWTAPKQDALVAGRYPSAGTGKYHGLQLCLFPTEGHILKANPDMVRVTGINFPSFNTKFGTSTNYGFIGIVERFWFPWDDAQTEPT